MKKRKNNYKKDKEKNRKKHQNLNQMHNASHVLRAFLPKELDRPK